MATVATATTHTRRISAARITAGVLGLALLGALAPIFPNLLASDALHHRTHEVSVVVYGLLFIAAMLALAFRPAIAPGALRVVLVAAVANGIVSFVTIGFDPLIPILLAAPIIVAVVGGLDVWRAAWVVPGRLAVLPALMMLASASYSWNHIQLQLRIGTGRTRRIRSLRRHGHCAGIDRPRRVGCVGTDPRSLLRRDGGRDRCSAIRSRIAGHWPGVLVWPAR